MFEESFADKNGSCCNAAWMVKAYLTDVASFQCLAFDLSQFGHEMFIFPLSYKLLRYVQVHLGIKEANIKLNCYLIRLNTPWEALPR